MRGVRKAFGATQALAGVTFEVAVGEVHALLGENGAGKSTLMKVLAGIHAPDAGTVEVDGEPFAPVGPLAARARGVAMIHQELALAPHATVVENVFLGRERTAWGWLCRREMAEATRAALRRLGHEEIAPGAKVSALSPAQRQVVEIARAIAFSARILVMDEPTSSLGPHEVERLFAIAREVAAQGVAVVLISHSFREVRAVAERFTVLRDGASVLTGSLAGVDDDDLVRAMAGRGLAPAAPPRAAAPGEAVLEVGELAGARLPRSASLVLRRGEILGIFGMAGAGRTELLRAVFGLDAARAGEVVVAGARMPAKGPGIRLARGLGMLSEDRQGEGLALARSVAENLTLSRLEPFARTLGVSLARRDEAARAWISALHVKAVGPGQRVSELSGGNQQKVALARLLHHDCDVLLLDEPTRGIDVGGRAEISRLLLELRAEGKAMLVVSSYVPELLALCDRVAVMHRGRLGEARPAAEWDEAGLVAAAAAGGSP
jgi:ribose transport system ATP-binding protein